MQQFLLHRLTPTPTTFVPNRRKLFAVVQVLLEDISGTRGPLRTRCASLSGAHPREFRPCFLQEEIACSPREARRCRRTYRRFVCSSRVGLSLELFHMGFLGKLGEPDKLAACKDCRLLSCCIGPCYSLTFCSRE
ncbi:hypothetical protein ElyMa_000318000 [Elysia marginata]|uniref:Uncharacterized protein n=1 Tax=Elysia marginata TaxID=1093978 RepID=A0AAV4F9G8_9GAST|nr:hypothetical protein ElyMa_000318000 [Elysia marginata]